MTGLLYLVPLALALGFGGLVAFLWALKSGQFDDMDGAAGRILFDEPDESGPPSTRPNPARRSNSHD